MSKHGTEPVITSVVCTLNRARYLEKALDSLIVQTMPTEQYEILVVDNGSTDSTRDAVLARAGRVGNLRYAREPVTGLSRARNSGWRAARGRFVAYLDDDAVACAEWLEAIVEAFEMVSPAPGCVGGRILPVFEAPRPPWLHDRLLSSLGAVDWPGGPRYLEDDEWLGGGNSAYPRHLLESMGGFSPRLGRVRGRLLSNEEILLRAQLRNAGYGAYYDPRILIRHSVVPSRLTKRWFRRRWYWQGVSTAIMDLQLCPWSAKQRLEGGLRHLARLVLSWSTWLHLARPPNAPGRFAQQCLVLSSLGYAIALLRGRGGRT